MTRIFALDYIDWCKKNKHAKSLKETQRIDWIRKFYKSNDWSQRPITGLELYIALGKI